MGLGDKISNAAEEAGGKVKEKTGETTGDRNLQAEASASNLRQTSSSPARKSRTPLKDSKTPSRATRPRIRSIPGPQARAD